jgi:hypothetical protein
VKDVKKLTEGINDIMSQTGLAGVRALANADRVLALVAPLARVIADGEQQWSRISGSVSLLLAILTYNF